ncbi:MAG: esterase/lipase family protein [Gemmatimonadales bacterium]
MELLLVHGMGRTALSLGRLARDLRRAGHRAQVLGYVAALEPFQQIVARIHSRLAGLAQRRQPYAVLGHSLGGLLVRSALALEPVQPLPVHLIMLGTPNRSPRLARRYGRTWLYRWFNGECGQVLGRPSFFDQLPPPPVPYTIIAGTGGRHGRLGSFGVEANDGVIAVSETLVSDMDAPVEIPVRHTFMMNDRRVREVIRRVLAGTAT